jgi:hypothetical protein
MRSLIDIHRRRVATAAIVQQSFSLECIVNHRTDLFVGVSLLHQLQLIDFTQYLVAILMVFAVGAMCERGVRVESVVEVAEGE